MKRATIGSDNPATKPGLMPGERAKTLLSALHVQRVSNVAATQAERAINSNSDFAPDLVIASPTQDEHDMIMNTIMAATRQRYAEIVAVIREIPDSVLTAKQREYVVDSIDWGSPLNPSDYQEAPGTVSDAPPAGDRPEPIATGPSDGPRD